MQKYYNPRLHNAVVAGTGMEHPRRPHVVLGSELNGYVQGDLVDANGICDLIHEKSTNTLARLDSLESSLKNETKARTQDKDNILASLNTLIADKLGSTETAQGESIERRAGDAALQLQIDGLTTDVNNKQDALVSGTNIKSIDDGAGNTISLLGSGNVSFKTINGQSIIGSDDIEVSSGGCDCAYQVLIKMTVDNGTRNYEVVKGNYATTRNKLENGEYVDLIGYVWVLDPQGDNIFIEKIYTRVEIHNLFIKITVLDSNNSLVDYLYWTADGISTEELTNPGTGGDSGADPEINK